MVLVMLALLLLLLLLVLCKSTHLVDIKASREVLARACRCANTMA
jgi:hypothetical protein